MDMGDFANNRLTRAAVLLGAMGLLSAGHAIGQSSSMASTMPGVSEVSAPPQGPVGEKIGDAVIALGVAALAVPVIQGVRRRIAKSEEPK